MRLRELQRDFQRHLLIRDDAIIAAVVDAPPLPAAQRLRIYGNAYRVRLLDALHDTYPSLHQILGDDVFTALGETFIEAHPSTHRSIRWYGRELAQFLAQQSPYAEQPILAELAAFEWLLSEVFDATDAAPADRRALQAVDPGAWSELRFQFHPSLRRMTLGWNTVAAWQSVSREEEPPPPEPVHPPTPWLLWRQNLMNRFRSLDATENAALDAALAGHCFGEICAALREWLPEEEIPLRAATLVGTWADSGIITAFAITQPAPR
jgi:hypothetical protein